MFMMYKNFIKRLLDFCIALCALSVLWPILLVITIFLYFANKGAGAIGKIVRSLSIDELSQLFNVLKGDMSFARFLTFDN